MNNPGGAGKQSGRKNKMFPFVITIHIVVCLALIFIVLLQHGRGAEMGSGFGGGSNQTLFGSTGAATFLSKITTVVAIAFMLTSLSLAVLSTRRSSTSRLIGTETSKPAPAAQPAAPPPPAVPAAQ
jgi:preprotein translocase subunit SecG